MTKMFLSLQQVDSLPLWMIAFDVPPFESLFLLPLIMMPSRFSNWAKKESKSLTRTSDFSSVKNGILHCMAKAISTVNIKNCLY